MHSISEPQKSKIFVETDRYKMISKSIFDYSWMDEILNPSEHVLIIAEGLLVYFTEEEVKNLINKLVDAFKDAEMILTIMPPAIVKRSSKQGVFSEMGAKAQWGIKNGLEMEKFNGKIKFVEEWNYMNYYKPRWKKMGWLFLIPGFKNKFGNRISHLKFN